MPDDGVSPTACLGQIASGIRLEIAEIKGILLVQHERVTQLERRVEALEKER